MNEDTPKGRVFGYCRVSSDIQAKHGFSLEAQEQDITSHFERRLKGEYVWGGMFRDPAVSGSIPFGSRPGGRQLTLGLQRGDVVMFTHLDRGFRNLRDLLERVEIWERIGVRVIFTTMDVDTGTPVGKLIISILGAVAEFVRKSMHERCTRGRIQARAEGKVVDPPKWGQKIVMKKGEAKIVADPEARKWASYFIELYARIGGSSYDDTIKNIYFYLIRHKVFRPYVGNTSRDRRPQLREWSPNAIKRFIKREQSMRKAEELGMPTPFNRPEGTPELPEAKHAE
jgi:DNA invertase Pin-like site-specific DNA recombinase